MAVVLGKLIISQPKTTQQTNSSDSHPNLRTAVQKRVVVFRFKGDESHSNLTDKYNVQNHLKFKLL